MRLKPFLGTLGKDERGTSAVELGLICSLIILAMLGAIQGFASESIQMWGKIKDKSSAAINGTPDTDG